MSRIWMLALVCLVDSPHAEITGPTVVAPGSPIVLNGKNARSERRLVWRLNGQVIESYDKPANQTDPAKPGYLVVVESAVLGTTYTFEQVAKGIPPGEKDLDATSVLHVVIVSGSGPAPGPPGPGPNPNPNPNPNPPPAPDPNVVVSGRLFLTYVMDVNAKGADAVAQAAFERNSVIDAACKTYDADYRVYQSNSDALKTYKLDTYAAAAGYPCLLIQVTTAQVNGKPAGAVLEPLKKPKPEDVAQRLKDLRGGK